MRHILILEDDDDLGKMFKRLLEDVGYRATHVSNPEEAMGLLSPLPIYPPDRFDFIWSAGIHWENCYTLAMEQYGLRNVIVVTSSDEIANDVDFLGAKSFTKPVVCGDLIEYIKKYCPAN